MNDKKMRDFSIENVITDVQTRLSADNPYSKLELEKLLRDMLYNVAYEKAELEAFPRILEGCDRFIDVGANAGRYVYMAARYLKNAEIIVIEANPYLKPLLEALIAELENSGNNNSFSVVSAAILDQSEEVEFFIGNSPTVSSLFTTDGKRRLNVKAVPLDTLYQPSHKTVIKIDVEGAEYRVLRSAQRFLNCNHTDFFMELHGWGDSSIHKYPINVAALFFQNGYAIEPVGEHFLFHRKSRSLVLRSHVAAAPMLILRYLAHRFASPLVPILRKIKGYI